MTTATLYSDYRPGRPCQSEPTIGLELYPPRTADGDALVWQRIDRLIAAAPSYVSVTYGAGGKTNLGSRRVLERIAAAGGVPSIAHLTCIGQSETETEAIITQMLQSGVRNFLAIRGDLPEGTEAQVPPVRAVNLVRTIRRIAARLLPAGVGSGPGGSGVNSAADPSQYVSIAVAYYPAASGRNRDNDIAALLEKQQAGADYAISQVFYDAGDYESYLRQATFAGVRIPLIAGIIPLTDIQRLRRLQQLTGVEVPVSLGETLIQGDGRLRVAAGLKATLTLCQQVVQAGAPGLHVFSFNRPRPALDVLSYIRGGGLLSPDQARRFDAGDENYWRLIDGALARIGPIT